MPTPRCLVAGPGIEPGTGAYETPVLPLHYPASIFTTVKHTHPNGHCRLRQLSEVCFTVVPRTEITS
jgi:hypothetical protein